MTPPIRSSTSCSAGSSRPTAVPIGPARLRTARQRGLRGHLKSPRRRRFSIDAGARRRRRVRAKEDSPMTRTVTTVAGAMLLGVTLAWATPPGPGQPFDCSGGGDTSCAADDTGCVSNSLNHAKCSSKIGKAFAKAVTGVISCHAQQATMRFQGSSINGAGNSEENCEENPGNSVKSKLDATLTALAGSGICDPIQLANAATEEAVLF